MTYPETLDWMFNQLPMYQKQGASAYKEDLTNTILLANHIHNPEKEVKTIHVAGTNGKGSTSHFLASILQEAGYKTGLYTSPHLKDFRERIKIDGEDISEDFVVRFIAQNKSFFEENQLSFFEMTVGLAFDYFRQEKVDIAIIEVGLGGRLDSTNIISPLLSVITNIGMDHVQFLGNTIEKIAFEKAGIIKPKTPVVIGEYTSETKPVFEKKANETQSDIFFASDLIEETYPSVLLGDYQKQNKNSPSSDSRIAISKPISNFGRKYKKWFLECGQKYRTPRPLAAIERSSKVICDTAHNKHGLEIVMNQVGNQKFDKLHLVLGVVNDKDLEDILPLFPKNATYYFCKPNIPRGLGALVLQEKANAFGLKGKVYNSVTEAYKNALENASEADFIYVGGSTFVVAEIL